MGRELLVRTMQAHDIATVLEIQSHCYNDATRESGVAFLSKLEASPASCFIATLDEAPAGYLVAVPACQDDPPALHNPAYTLPPVADCLYLHDLAVAPHARGNSVAEALVAAFFRRLAQLGLRTGCLTAVNASGSYWERYGFRAVAPSALANARLATYGKGAQYMRRDLGA